MENTREWGCSRGYKPIDWRSGGEPYGTIEISSTSPERKENYVYSNELVFEEQMQVLMKKLKPGIHLKKRPDGRYRWVPTSDDEIRVPESAIDKLLWHQIPYKNLSAEKKAEFHREIFEICSSPTDDLSEMVEVGRITDPNNPVIKAGFKYVDGLFAKKRLKKGKILAAYTGEVQTSKLNDDKAMAGDTARELYTVELDETAGWFDQNVHEMNSPENPILLAEGVLVIDGTVVRNETAFANDYRDDIRNAGATQTRKINMKFINVEVGKMCVCLVVIVEDVQAYEEILTDYGEQYWMMVRKQQAIKKNFEKLELENKKKEKALQNKDAEVEILRQQMRTLGTDKDDADDCNRQLAKAVKTKTREGERERERLGLELEKKEREKEPLREQLTAHNERMIREREVETDKLKKEVADSRREKKEARTKRREEEKRKALKRKAATMGNTVKLSCTSLVCPFNRGHNNNAPKNFGKHLKKCKVSGFPSVTCN
jgi:hypothetical protein